MAIRESVRLHKKQIEELVVLERTGSGLEDSEEGSEVEDSEDRIEVEDANDSM